MVMVKKNVKTKKKKKKNKNNIEIKFKWVDTETNDAFDPAISFFGDPEIKFHLIDPDALVIKEQEIKIGFSYPLENSVERDYHAIGGFSRLLLAQCIYEGYCVIYEEEDLEKYGVWGHSMGDLTLIGVEYILEEKYCMLKIVS